MSILQTVITSEMFCIGGAEKQQESITI